jgi:uncharacterized protein (DUF58 family)
MSRIRCEWRADYSARQRVERLFRLSSSLPGLISLLIFRLALLLALLLLALLLLALLLLALLLLGCYQRLQQSELELRSSERSELVCRGMQEHRRYRIGGLHASSNMDENGCARKCQED